ncbi:hypothetical protein [Glycomyces tenuis]|uniref:hypothetical protein n=1 Tax=Glycomyces tenuis TaxID=58116 RepID=UPI0003FE1A97|nr:hypothetical protein [Glycomyces tenuis]
MNGPQHCRRAEQLLFEALDDLGLSLRFDRELTMQRIALAQVHASPAAAAAVVDADVESLTPQALGAWGSVIRGDP